MKLKFKNLLLVTLGILILSAIVTYLQINSQKQQSSKIIQEQVNEQKFTTFKEGKFQVNYPNWPNSDPTLVAEPQVIKVTISNAGCNFIIARNNPGVRIGQVEINYQMGKNLMHSLVNRYLSAKRIYSVIFIAQKSVFDSVCRPFAEKTFASVKY